MSDECAETRDPQAATAQPSREELFAALRAQHDAMPMQTCPRCGAKFRWHSAVRCYECADQVRRERKADGRAAEPPPPTEPPPPMQPAQGFLELAEPPERLLNGAERPEREDW